MNYLDFEKKLKIKEFIEKSYCLSKDEKIFNLLKGSLYIEEMNSVEELLKETTVYYLEQDKKKEVFKEAKSICIGKVIAILTSDEKEVLETISLKEFDSGVDNYKKIIEEMNQEYANHCKKEINKKDELDLLVEKFKSFGKGKKIEKGKILEEIEEILSENKELGKKTDMWKNLKISNSGKSMLCKRYNLFKEFQENENFSEDKEMIKRAIENMTDLNLKKITKDDTTLEEKENMVLSLI